MVSRLSASRTAAACLLGLVPFLALPPRWLWSLLPLLALRAGAAAWLGRRLGGYTGDCLGAVQQLGELACLLVFIALP